LKEPVEAIVQDDPAEIDASDRDKQEQQQFQQDLMHHHRLLMKQYVDLMEHHCLVQELYSNLRAHPYGMHGYDHVLQEYHQALREHHRMVGRSASPGLTRSLSTYAASELPQRATTRVPTPPPLHPRPYGIAG